MQINHFLEVKNLSKTFYTKKETIHAVDNVSLNVDKSEVVAIIGGSGSGKSTFLRCLNKLEEADSGEIIYNGNNINSPFIYTTDGKKLKNDINLVRKKVGMVFQHFNLFPNYNVIDNMTLAPVTLKVLTKEEAKEKAISLLKTVGLTNRADSFPHELSGGQKQRIAIVRALMMDPRLLLFDEPTSALDPEMVGEVLKVMKDLAAKGMTMIVVTHEMGFAREVANKLVFMENGKKIVEGDPKELFNNPSNPRLREFLSKEIH